MSEVTFEWDGAAWTVRAERVIREPNGHYVSTTRHSTTTDELVALIDQHPEIAEAAGWVRKETACKEAENAIRGYRLQNTLDLMDDGPLDIIYALTPPGEANITLGRKELDSLVDAVCGAIVYAPTEGSE